MATTTRLRPPNKLQPPAKPSRAKGPLPPKKHARPKLADDDPFGDTPPFTIYHYGPSGVGKTSMWAYMPKVGFLYDPKEEGILDLYKSGQCPEPIFAEEVDDFQQTMNRLADIANQKYDISSLVLDSSSGFQQLCFNYHCAEYFGNDWSNEGFLAFQRGPKNAAKTDWPLFLGALDDVRKSGIRVVLIGHSTVKTFQNPEGPDYDQFLPDLDKEIWSASHRWAKAVIFQNFDVSLEKAKGSAKFKSSGGEGRLLYTAPAAAYHAKNRWGLEPVITAGGTPQESYEAFVSAYRKAWKL